MVRSTPLAATSASRAPAASKWSRASVSGRSRSAASAAMTAAAKPGGAFSPVPDRGAAQRQLADVGQRRRGPLDAVPDRRRVAAELLARA